MIRGLAISNVTTIKDYNKVCEIVGDDVDNEITQKQIDECFKDGDVLLYDDGLTNNWMYYWNIKSKPKDMKIITLEEFYNLYGDTHV